MIPKIIHYSWISTDEKPLLVQQCMETWKRYLPDYEFVLWDAERINKEIDSVFVEEAIRCKKWAFAADYVRLYAVYTYGGIWLDTDVEMRESLSAFTERCHFFIGQEAALFFAGENAYRDTHLTAHCFGAEPQHPYLKQCLSYYDGRHFILSSNESLPDQMRYDQRLLPEIMAKIAAQRGYDQQGIAYNRVQTFDGGKMTVYPSWYFDAPKSPWKKNVYCVHQCAMSWGRTGVPGRRKTGTWKQWLANGLMDILNIVPRWFGKSLAVTFVKW